MDGPYHGNEGGVISNVALDADEYIKNITVQFTADGKLFGIIFRTNMDVYGPYGNSENANVTSTNVIVPSNMELIYVSGMIPDQDVCETATTEIPQTVTAMPDDRDAMTEPIMNGTDSPQNSTDSPQNATVSTQNATESTQIVTESDTTTSGAPTTVSEAPRQAPEAVFACPCCVNKIQFHFGIIC